MRRWLVSMADQMGGSRAGTRPAPTGACGACGIGAGGREGRHKACPYWCGVAIAEVAQGQRQGRHKACPYRCGVAIAEVALGQRQGRHKACPYRCGIAIAEVAQGQRQGRHKACLYRSFGGGKDGTDGRPGQGRGQLIYMFGIGWDRGVGVSQPGGRGTWWNTGTRWIRHVAGEGALRGRSPRTREGRIGPTARNCSGQWLVVSGQRVSRCGGGLRGSRG